MPTMIDWPNLLAGSLIGIVFAGLWHLIAKRDADKNHRQLMDAYQHLVSKLEKLEEQGTVKIEKDRKGYVINVEPGKISMEGSSPTLLIDPVRLREPPE